MFYRSIGQLAEREMYKIVAFIIVYEGVFLNHQGYLNPRTHSHLRVLADNLCTVHVFLNALNHLELLIIPNTIHVLYKYLLQCIA